MKKTITARAPATIANLICGYDTLALAIDGLYDEVSIQPNESGQWVITEIVNGPGIPLDPKKNVCTAAMEAMRQAVGDSRGYDVQIVKGYQAGSGLGSSAASAIAALWAYNAQLDYPVTREQIIRYGMLSEQLVSGEPIADNVAAAALGGIVLIRSAKEHDFISLPTPDLFVGALLPDVQIITKEARGILPKQIPLATSVQQGANLAGFISALYSGDTALLSRSMHDHIIEQYRGTLIPHYYKVKEIAMENGALCFGIGGSGPAVFYFCRDELTAGLIANKIEQFWTKNQLRSISNVGRINTRGVEIITK